MQVEQQFIPSAYDFRPHATVNYSPTQKILSIPWKYADHFKGAESLEVVNRKNNQTLGRLTYIHNNIVYYVAFGESAGNNFKNCTLSRAEKLFWLRLTWRDPKKEEKQEGIQCLDAYQFAEKVHEMDLVLGEFRDPQKDSGKKHCGRIMVIVRFSDSEGPVLRPVYWFYDQDFKDRNIEKIKQKLKNKGIPLVVK
jgi:hypothetical protein